MRYINPIRILSPDQITRLEASTIKSIKKEILLHFQLTEDITIERNGFKLDKNRVLELFEELEKNLTLHLRIFENKLLLQFLENKNHLFFYRPDVQQLVIEDKANDYAINEYIVSELNNMIAGALEKPNEHTPFLFSEILKYTSKIPKEQQDKAYQKAYLFAKAKVDALRLSYSDPFVSENSFAFHDKLQEQVNFLFYNCFANLPAPFAEIGARYAIWCHNNIVVKVIRKSTFYDNYDWADLLVLREAYDVAVHVANGSAIKTHRASFRNYMNAATTEDTRLFKGNFFKSKKGTEANTNTSSKRRPVKQGSEENPVLGTFLLFLVVYVVGRILSWGISYLF
jgi:hypothetical protein